MVPYGTFVKLRFFSYDLQMVTDPSDSISDRIITAAARRFVEDGYGGTSMLSIAGDARTSKREIYDRFGSKQALFGQVMRYLCALGDEQDTGPNAASLSDMMTRTAHAVLNRFLLPETRGVLVTAFGADQKFPEIPRLFWSAGPGQAVTALTDLFVDHPDVQISDKQEAHARAHAFIMSCVGPATLSYLFDPDFELDDAARDEMVQRSVARTLEQIVQGD